MRCGIEIRIGLRTLLGFDQHPAEIPGWGPVDPTDARLLVDRQHAAEWRFAILDDDGYLEFGGLVRRRPTPTSQRGRAPTRGGIVEIHIRAADLAGLAGRCPPGWAGVVADLAEQYRRRDELLARLDARPEVRFPPAGLRRHIELRDRTCVAPGCRRPARAVEQDHTRDHARGGATVRANLGPLCWRHHRMKHRGGWSLTQPEPGIFLWRSPLGQRYRTRGEPIAPDLPDPVPGPDPRPDDPDLNPTGPVQDSGPIFSRPPPDRGPPPKPDPPRDQSGPDDDVPPF